ncbi:MAG: toll/interleukin-1 receptor domain-containing protein [Chloroflexi bacterium]|nr:toll/interleukin-1 receptor domain-containing protein [Chloroflexota bacterium]
MASILTQSGNSGKTAAMDEGQPRTPLGSDVFISYSSKDVEFATTLRLHLELARHQVWQDIKDIELTDQWWSQIKAGIAASDNFLFVASADSMSSPVCHLELEHARALKKRLLIVRHGDAVEETCTRAMLDRILTKEYLKRITAGRDMIGIAGDNWRAIDAEQNIPIASKEELLGKVPRLIDAFDKDLLYVRQGSLLLGRALEWEESGRSASFLLIGDALGAAERWRDAGKAPPPSPKHVEFIRASRRAEDRRRWAARSLIAAGVFALGMIILLIATALGSAAEAERANSSAIAANATAAQAGTRAAEARVVADQAETKAAEAKATEAAVVATLSGLADNTNDVLRKAATVRDVEVARGYCVLGLTSMFLDRQLTIDICERLVDLAPEQDKHFYIDYLGMAQAQAGDLASAAESFRSSRQYLLTFESTCTINIELRTTWINLLEAGSSPFDDPAAQEAFGNEPSVDEC